MKNDLENPFADYGRIVSGERFIGRQADLQAIENRTIRPSAPGNLAIVGDSSVGKSSLVWQAVMEPKDRLLKNKQVPLWINLATYDTRSHFFLSLVTECFDELEELGWLTEPIVNTKDRALQDKLSWPNVIRANLIDQDGESWISELEKRRPNLKPIFQRCREAQQKEEKAFGSRASHNLLDFTYPQDLFDILFAEWNVFGSIFKKDKNYWSQRSQLLAKVRNPLAHNRDQSLYEHDLQIAEGYCKEILAVLNG